MLLSSVTKHVKDQNWFAVWIDLLIVIVGVFIGIQVANWNASRVNDTRATAYLERIVQDVDVDLASINVRNKISQFYNEAATQVFADSRPLYREHVRGYIPIKLQNYIWEHCYSTDNAAKQTLINCKSPELEVNISEVLQTIINDKILIRELRYWLSSQRVFFIVGDYQTRIANVLRDVIQQELKPQNDNRDKDANN